MSHLEKVQGSDPNRLSIVNRLFTIINRLGSDPTRRATGPSRRARRSFLSHFGGVIAGFIAGVPLIHPRFSHLSDDSTLRNQESTGHIQARIHPMAVPRTSTRSLPNV